MATMNKTDQLINAMTSATAPAVAIGAPLSFNDWLIGTRSANPDHEQQGQANGEPLYSEENNFRHESVRSFKRSRQAKSGSGPFHPMTSGRRGVLPSTSGEAYA